MQRKSSSYGCTWLLEHLKLNVLLAKFKKTLVSVKYSSDLWLNFLDGLSKSQKKQMLRNLKEMEEHRTNIRSTCKRGHGRHALRLLDTQFSYEAPKIAARASGVVVQGRVPNMDALGPYVAKFKLATPTFLNASSYWLGDPAH